ncbi:hypothetical protein; RMQ08197 [Methylorubrum extorquens AM1]|uniref:Uncharacterized protein n=1 Tax=Methylorubrum extorquens (strain ATCC 14718 / DSM 1338 / JCM 2805 / NCIMB 9133 / AM1) TaxID=272630 RepID=C5AW22_METEA|nr:hypothetical protein; RMQ08197 [Methylorubrum extorquens AM1]
MKNLRGPEPISEPGQWSFVRESPGHSGPPRIPLVHRPEPFHGSDNGPARFFLRVYIEPTARGYARRGARRARKKAPASRPAPSVAVLKF